MSNFFKNILFLLIILFLFSCEKEITIKETQKPFAVLNSFFSPDSLFKINISQSLSIFDEENFKSIENAEIKLFEDNKLIGNFNYVENGNYTINYYPKANKKYSISCNTVLGNYTASNYVPQKIKIQSIDTSTVIKDSSKKLKCIITFLDNIQQENYYLLDIQAIAGYYSIEYPIGHIDTTYFRQSLDFYYENKIIENKIGILGYSYGVIFSDKFISGKQTSIDVYLDYYQIGVKTPNTIKFYLKNISKEYFLYAKSYSHLINYDNEIIGEPIQVFTNIENGFGIFGGYSQDVDSIIYLK